MKSAILKLNYLMGLLGLILFSACSKQDSYMPNKGQIAYINFYHAADGLRQYGGFRLYINDTTSEERKLEYRGHNDFSQYPSTVTGTDLAVDYLGSPSDVTYDVVYWLPLKTGSYHFLYNSISADNKIKGTVIDNNTNLQTQSFTTQYIMESLQSDTSYQVLNIPVERKGVPGKVRIQVVNLSPDLGPLEVYREDNNGSKINEGLPVELASGNYSAYTELDTAGAGNNLGQLLLKIRKAGSTDVLFTAPVPAISKSSFIVVVQGFASQTNRRIRNMQNSGPDFVQIAVDPKLRYNVRRVY